ncbi:SH3 domain-containing protein [Thioclava sp. FTW29]|uniref:SH3 domain-containing protein n=1 Tax=Thioclava litoralis TaxID=3076557 RepID=A0ABZ1E6L5_9RHOB|nr:SH3 domain-containing protein [Thioclava sp. FTW29]
MRGHTFLKVMALALLAGCTGMGSGGVVVKGAGPDELLKLRAGPGLGYNIIMGLPNGTQLKKHECVTEVGQLWCHVSLVNAPQVMGYVSADYLAIR